MSQKQIHSLEILSLGGDDLKQAIRHAVDENPALVLKKTKSGMPGEFTKIGSVGKNGELASDNYQKLLEAQEESKTSLIDNFLQQLNIADLPSREHDLCEKLITNLSDKGYHILSPLTFLDAKTTKGLLDKCLSIVQHMTPEGCCTKDVEESLFVQAKMKENPPADALFILNGHLDFLNPPQPERIIKRINEYLSKKNSLFGAKPDLYENKLDLSEEAIEEAVAFIRTLDPFPAREYGTGQTHFVAPDVYVKKLTEDDPEYGLTENIEDGRLILEGEPYLVKLSRDTAPELAINPEYENATSKKGLDDLKKARELIQVIQDRVNTIQKAACIIVKKQKEFFLRGPGNLNAFTQKDLSVIMELHESTISRMANSKYIQCDWGLFEIKYFFSASVSKTGGSDHNISKDNVVSAMMEILNDHANDKKSLSDQKLSDLLKEKGITIARRTVAKYRSQLNIESSYTR